MPGCRRLGRLRLLLGHANRSRRFSLWPCRQNSSNIGSRTGQNVAVAATIAEVLAALRYQPVEHADLCFPADRARWQEHEQGMQGDRLAISTAQQVQLLWLGAWFFRLQRLWHGAQPGPV